MTCANGFFRLAGNPVRALTRPDAWQRWEVDCFLSLHGDGYRALSPWATEGWPRTKCRA